MAETTNDLNSLTKSLGADFPVLPVSKGKKPVSSQEYSDTLIKIAPEKIKAIEQMGTAEQKQKEIQAGGKRKVTEEFAGLLHEDTEKYDKEFEKLKQPEFAPTKENAQSLGELFSLVATMGVMLGGGGKMAAQGAMDAMGGMLKGWQSGRKDLYERQLKEYDKETKRIDSERTALTNKLSRLSQLRLSDKEAAYALQEEIAAQFPGVIAATVRNQSIDVVFQLVNSLQKQATSREEKEESLRLRRDIAAMKSAGGGEGRSGKTGDRFGFGAIVATASNEAAASMRNLMGLPMESTSGIFGGRQTNSLFTAPADAFANTITKESTQRYNAEAGKLSYTLSQLIKGGRVVSVNEVAIMDNILKIKEGDSLETAATRLAEARQIAERAMEVRLKDPNTPVDLKEIYQDNLNSVKSIIPFTVDDVNKFVQERDKSITFSEELKNKYNKSTPTETKITPTQNDRDIAKQSPELRAKFVKHFGVEP